MLFHNASGAFHYGNAWHHSPPYSAGAIQSTVITDCWHKAIGSRDDGNFGIPFSLPCILYGVQFRATI